MSNASPNPKAGQSSGTLYQRGNRWHLSFMDSRGRRVRESAGTANYDDAAAVLARRVDEEWRLKRSLSTKQEIAAEKAKQLTISDVVERFLMGLKAERRTQKHIDSTRRNIETLCDACGFVVLDDIDPEPVHEAIEMMRAEGLSDRTVQARVIALKQLTRWASGLKSPLLKSDPLSGLRRPQVRFQSRERRALSAEEVFLLVEAAEQSPVSLGGMPGRVRAVLYALAVQTGLRASEIAALRVGDLRLTGPAPFVLLAGSKTKNGKPARQFVGARLAEALKAITENRTPAARAIPMHQSPRLAEVVAADLRAARKAWIDAAEGDDDRSEREQSDFLRVVDSMGQVIDFHSLRHTCGTLLAESGAGVKLVQSVMRHSTPELSIGRYGHLFDRAEAGAVSSIEAVTRAGALPGAARKAEPVVAGRVG